MSLFVSLIPARWRASCSPSARCRAFPLGKYWYPLLTVLLLASCANGEDVEKHGRGTVSLLATIGEDGDALLCGEFNAAQKFEVFIVELPFGQMWWYNPSPTQCFDCGEIELDVDFRHYSKNTGLFKVRHSGIAYFISGASISQELIVDFSSPEIKYEIKTDYRGGGFPYDPFPTSGSCTLLSDRDVQASIEAFEDKWREKEEAQTIEYIENLEADCSRDFRPEEIEYYEEHLGRDFSCKNIQQ